ncbi:MAG TPA: prepilin-type N-terminal cleavage/methylation domain-containing protein [Gemmatimonadaceae bacterium]|nr:prepilin-type N-terminal cleavage/methylation domain-containing protein [Gemmatimonadaceae bacterium]
MNKVRAGFTLVELLVAILILSIGLVGLASTMAAMTRWQMLSASRAEMTLLADGKLERLRAAGAVLSPDTAELRIGGSVDTPADPHTDIVVGPSSRRFVLLWSVAAGPATTRDVRLRVRPEVDVPQTPAKLDFATLIALKQ